MSSSSSEPQFPPDGSPSRAARRAPSAGHERSQLPPIRSYLIVSDLHLMEVEEHADGWKRYKSARYHIDSALAELVGTWVSEAQEGAQCALILNGDIFDFDLVTAVPDDPPWPVSTFERLRGLDPTEEKSAFKLQRMVDDHPIFIDTLAHLAALGHEVVYLFGNHDRELHFDAVKDTLRSAIAERGRRAGHDLDPASVIRFEPWFYHVPGQLYAEHGNQYDRFSSFRYVLHPTFATPYGETLLAVPMGDLSCRYLINRMGFFNPHSEDFRLNVFSYVAHWARHYAFKGRPLVSSWFWGSLMVLIRSLRTRRWVSALGGARHEARRKAQAERWQLDPATVEALDKGRVLPVTDRLFWLSRELWLERLVIAVAMTGGTVALALSAVPLWLKLMIPLCVFPLVYLIYEAIVGEVEQGAYDEMPQRARRIAELTGARVVALGHTHDPMVVPLSRGTTFVNTGTWAPMWDGDPEQAILGTRNYARVEVVGDRVSVQLDSWSDGPAVERIAHAPVPEPPMADEISSVAPASEPSTAAR